METKKKTKRRKVAEALCARVEKMIVEDRKARQARDVQKLLKIAGIGTIVLMTSACSVADPANSGIAVDAQMSEISVPESGSLTVTHTYTRSPSNTGANSGTVYNRRKLSDYF